MLDTALTVTDGLYVFRCLVTVGFDEPQPVEELGEVELFSRLYAVTATSFTDAMQQVEAWGGRGADAAGEPRGSVDGFLEEIDVALMDPDDVSRELVEAESLGTRGVHFASEALDFDDDDEQVLS